MENEVGCWRVALLAHYLKGRELTDEARGVRYPPPGPGGGCETKEEGS